jgi:ATP-dependent RNA helicase DDX54/DBP10
MDQTARNANLAAFRGRRCRVLVVTDVAARGIDIPLLDNVINYDFPDKPKLFVHRTGKTSKRALLLL